MEDFLTSQPTVTPNEEEMVDIERRKALDAKRVEAQKEFYEFARKRAQELDVYMEQFRQDIVEGREWSPFWSAIGKVVCWLTFCGRRLDKAVQ